MLRNVFAATALISCLSIGYVSATDVDVEMKGYFLTAIVLANPVPLDFSNGTTEKISYVVADLTNADKLRIATSGARTKVDAGSAGYILPDATGTAGQVTISGVTGEGVYVTCDASAVMADTAGTPNTIAIGTIEFIRDDGIHTGAAWTVGTNVCAGKTDTGAGRLAITLAGDATDAVLIGAEVAVNAIALGGAYSTANTGGTIPQFRVVYQ